MNLNDKSILKECDNIDEIRNSITKLEEKTVIEKLSRDNITYNNPKKAYHRPKKKEHKRTS